MLAGARGRRRARARGARAATAWRERGARDRARRSAAIASILRRDGRDRVRASGAPPARHLVGDDARHAVAARRPDLRRRRAGGARRRERSRAVGACHVRRRRRHRGALPRARRRAPARRDPARAGRQRADRDGGGLRSRRLRGRRRPHDRSARRARSTSSSFRGLAACGGFSYGDVLGAGEGWAKSILFNARARDMFAAFFDAARHVRARRVQRLPDAGGAQGDHPGRRAVAALRAQPQRAVRGAPGAGRGRPRARRCSSRAWSARACRSRSRTARAAPSGRPTTAARARRGARGWSPRASSTTAAAPTELYPDNPNGSPGGITALTTRDGRVTIIMPHPERVFRTVQYSWHPREWGEDSPWMRMFRNARVWVG